MTGSFMDGFRTVLTCARAIALGIAPWCLLWFGLKVVLVLGWSPGDRAGSWSWWSWAIASDLGHLIPFLLFAGGVALRPVLARTFVSLRTVVLIVVACGGISYGLDAWVSPELRDRHVDSFGSATADVRRFGPETPIGILRNLRYVEANPPAEYSLRLESPHQTPPNVLRWRLHFPAAQAVFGILNILLGVVSAELTANLGRGSRRNARLAIGVLGGLAFFGCLELASPVPPFLLDGTLRPGVLAAWAPLAFPALELFVLWHLARR